MHGSLEPGVNRRQILSRFTVGNLAARESVSVMVEEHEAVCAIRRLRALTRSPYRPYLA